MGKTGSSSPPPIVIPPAPDIGAEMGPMMEAISAQMAAIAAMAAQPPPLPPMPQATQIPSIDWDAKKQAVLDQQRIEEQDAARRRTGVSKTIVSSPLIDEDEDSNLLTIDVLAN